jgi:hypothetical protein
MTAFRTQPSDLRWAILMEMDFVVYGPLVRRLAPLIRFLFIASCVC